MKLRFLTLVTLVISISGYSQISIGDSIQLSQDRSLKQIRKEINSLVIEVAKIDSTKFRKPTIAISTSDTTLVSIESKSINELKESKGFWDLLYRSFGNLFAAILGGAIALFVFYGRWKKERVKDLEEKERILNEKNDYMKSVLQAVIGLSEKYKVAVDEFTTEIRSKPFDIPDITLYPLQEFGRLQKIVDNEQYFHAYIKKYGNNDQTLNNYRTIASLTDYLNSQSAELFKKDYKIRDFKRKERYIQMFQEIIEESSEYGESCEFSHNSIFLDIEQILKNYIPYRTKENQTNIEIHQTEFIKPLRDLILSKYYNVPELRILLNKISRITQLFGEIPFQNMQVVKDFEVFHKVMNEVIERLKKESKTILG
ncbi:MAG: hypothetical protein KBF92_09900 [Bacteroidia bacterium]|nr:hypothetical protein [Bacteroidia bacterium]